MLRMSIALFIGSIGWAMAAVAADGDLDPGFADGGRLLIGAPDQSFLVGAAAVQPDGCLLLAGGLSDVSGGFFLNKIALWRFDAHGVADADFGEKGQAVITIDEPFAQATGVAQAGNGDLLLSAISGFRVARFRADGAPAVGFGAGGQVVLDFAASGYGNASAMAVVEDRGGRVVVVGGVGDGGSPGTYAPVLARVSGAGIPDESFGDGGRRIVELGTPAAPRDGWLSSLLALRDGGVLAVGSAAGEHVTDGRGFLAVRLDADGELAPGFGVAGIVFVQPPEGYGRGRQVVADRDGFLLAGSCRTGDVDAELCVLRLRADGSPDPAYGTGGWAHPAPGRMVRADVGAALQSDGRLLLSASSPFTSPVEFLVARLDWAGHPDAGFGDGGAVTIGFDTAAGISASARAITVQGGRPVIAGEVSGDGVPSLAAVRLENALVFAGGFE
ncbi:MAG: hypothetical protein J0H15_10530 [Xanthomonadales bacterium]|nr:hypothetical protein [Xanthomonadales bacterium]